MPQVPRGLPTALAKLATALGELPTALGELPTALGVLPTALGELPTAPGERRTPLEVSVRTLSLYQGSVKLANGLPAAVLHSSRQFAPSSRTVRATVRATVRGGPNQGNFPSK